LNNQNNFRAEEEAENIVNYQIQNEQIVQNKDQEDNSSIINVKNEVDQEALSATSSSSIIDKGEEIDNNSQRYPKRNRKPTERYISGECIPKPLKKHQANQLTQSISQIYLIETDFIKEEPVNLRDALKRPEKNEWMKAIESEYESLKENNTWTITILPKGKNVIDTKWVFKLKRYSNNNISRFKARLVAKGFQQEEGIDFTETFAPVVKLQSLRLLLAIGLNENLLAFHLDISTAFLFGEIEEDIYINVPEGFETTYPPNKVLKLNKALYGLKQAPRSWNKMLVSYLDKQGFTQLKTDTCIFMNKQLIIAIYVDDIVVLGKTIEQITEFKNYISNKFKTKDLGHLKYILGITIEKLNNNTLIIHQKNYIEKIIKRFKYLDESKETEIPIQPNHNLTSDLRHENENLRKFIDSTKYREVIGSLIYLMTCNRPDISY
jgi:hypothetical protein